MALSSASAIWGISGVDAATSEYVSGSFTIGRTQQNTSLSAARVGYAYAIEVDGAGSVAIDLQTGVATPTGAGTAQVETYTAAGTVTQDGNLNAVVAGDDFGPVQVPVAVVSGDSAATWAGKVRTALNANGTVTATWTVGGSSNTITLTRISPAKNDIAFGLTMQNGTAAGITQATSTDTTPGVGPAKAYRIAGNAASGDFEGKALPTDLDLYYGHIYEHSSGEGIAKITVEASAADSFETQLSPGGGSQEFNPNGFDHISGASGNQEIIVTSSSGGWSKIIVALFCAREA